MQVIVFRNLQALRMVFISKEYVTNVTDAFPTYEQRVSRNMTQKF